MNHGTLDNLSDGAREALLEAHRLGVGLLADPPRNLYVVRRAATPALLEKLADHRLELIRFISGKPLHRGKPAP
jgi:hypothetical protein